MKSFSDRLKQARVMRGFTQQALARASGLSQSAIGSYETGQRQSSRAVRELATALSVNLDWLEQGRGPMESLRASSPSYTLMEPSAALHSVTWPFDTITHTQITALSCRDRRLLENVLRNFIDACLNDDARSR